MPTYQYECSACDFTFEHFQSMSSPKLKDCPSCNKPELVRLIGSGGGMIFKGSGFYETDYKRKTPSSSEKEESKSDASPSNDCGSGSCGCC